MAGGSRWALGLLFCAACACGSPDREAASGAVEPSVATPPARVPTAEPAAPPPVRPAAPPVPVEEPPLPSVAPEAAQGEPAQDPAAVAPEAAQGEPAPMAVTAGAGAESGDGDDESEDEEDEYEPPRFDPALAAADRLGPGPWDEDEDIAAGAGWIDFARDEELGQLAEVEHQRRTYALVTAQRGTFGTLPLLDLWLVRLESRVDEGVQIFRRQAAVRLYQGAVEGGCGVQSELRARDVDGDGEVEVTVIADFFRPAASEDEECGAVAFLVGGDDLGIQARFSRQYHYEHSGADGDTTEIDDTTWQFRDDDADGHADLRVIQTWRFSDDFSGDDVGDGDTMPGQHSRGSDRREVICPWIAAEDVWRCPGDPGQRLFGPPVTQHTARRPW